MGIRTEVPVRDYMSQPVETISAEAPLRAAADRMREQNVNALIITESVSILTSTDLVGVIADGDDIDQLSVGAVATDVTTTIGPETTLTQAASAMLRNDSSHLPVVDGDEIIGILSQTDITRQKA